MKKILLLYLISYFCLNIIACSTKNNTEGRNVLFFRDSYGEMGWHNTGNIDKDGKYVGETKKNKPHGQGTYTYYKNPKSSINQLSLLIPQMPKLIVFAITLWQMLNQGKEENLPAQYVGEWNRGKKHGKGTYFFPNGDKYEGKWKHGKKHGQGKYFFPTGDSFIGKWKDGKVHGKGMYTYPDGEKFMGEWKDGEKHLQGPLIFSN